MNGPRLVSWLTLVAVLWNAIMVTAILLSRI